MYLYAVVLLMLQTLVSSDTSNRLLLQAGHFQHNDAVIHLGPRKHLHDH